MGLAFGGRGGWDGSGASAVGTSLLTLVCKKMDASIDLVGSELSSLS